MQFKKREHKRLSLDVTPLIDVIFLLLIFFMISTTFPDSPGIKVNLPFAETKAPPKVEKNLSIYITEKNKMFINGVPVEEKTLKDSLIRAKNEMQQDLLIIKADGQVKHELVVYVMDSAKKAGIRKLSIATTDRKKK